MRLPQVSSVVKKRARESELVVKKRQLNLESILLPGRL